MKNDICFGCKRPSMCHSEETATQPSVQDKTSCPAWREFWGMPVHLPLGYIPSPAIASCESHASGFEAECPDCVRTLAPATPTAEELSALPCNKCRGECTAVDGSYDEDPWGQDVQKCPYLKK